jgi:hypothetical protein
MSMTMGQVTKWTAGTEGKLDLLLKIIEHLHMRFTCWISTLMPIQATASYTKQIICNKSMACFLSVNLIPIVLYQRRSHFGHASMPQSVWKITKCMCSYWIEHVFLLLEHVFLLRLLFIANIVNWILLHVSSKVKGTGSDLLLNINRDRAFK